MRCSQEVHVLGFCGPTVSKKQACGLTLLLCMKLLLLDEMVFVVSLSAEIHTPAFMIFFSFRLLTRINSFHQNRQDLEMPYSILSTNTLLSKKVKSCLSPQTISWYLCEVVQVRTVLQHL